MSGKRPQIHITVDPELLAAVTAEAAKNFESVSGVAEARLRASYNGAVEPAKTALGSVKEESATIDLAMKQLRLAQLRKNLLTVDGAVGVMESTFAEMRVEGHSMLNDIASEFNLDAEMLRRRFDTAMAGPFGMNAEPFEQLAKDFSREPLP
ncbi:MAG: hypothetical protein PSV22_11975 [Pseudolabrys sp.]|nr:hypothetical protein [Pseudolabrys sp.]